MVRTLVSPSTGRRINMSPKQVTLFGVEFELGRPQATKYHIHAVDELIKSLTEDQDIVQKCKDTLVS